MSPAVSVLLALKIAKMYLGNQRSEMVFKLWLESLLQYTNAKKWQFQEIIQSKDWSYFHLNYLVALKWRLDGSRRSLPTGRLIFLAFDSLLAAFIDTNVSIECHVKSGRSFAISNCKMPLLKTNAIYDMNSKVYSIVKPSFARLW